MSEITLLTEDRWMELEGIFEREFDNSALPKKGKANIVAAMDEGGRIKGFIVVETLLRAGQIYVDSETQEKDLPRKFFAFLEKNIPRGASVVVIASEERFEGLVKHLGFREIKGKVFRRDL